MSQAHDRATHHYNLGVQYEHENRPEQAAAEYRRALKHDPQFPYPWKALGELLYRDGNLEPARDALKKALSLDPEWVEVMALLARILHDLGETDRALPLMERALRVEPDNAAFNTDYGRMLVAAERYDEAMAALNRALEHEPDSLPARRNMAVACGKRAMAHLDQSIDHWREALRLSQEDPALFRNLGIALFHRGLLDQAAAAFRDALRRNPDDPVAARFLKFSESVNRSG